MRRELGSQRERKDTQQGRVEIGVSYTVSGTAVGVSRPPLLALLAARSLPQNLLVSGNPSEFVRKT